MLQKLNKTKEKFRNKLGLNNVQKIQLMKILNKVRLCRMTV
jgi:hypothetical protein